MTSGRDEESLYEEKWSKDFRTRKDGMMKCGQCGEIVYSASVMERIDEILERVKI